MKSVIFTSESVTEGHPDKVSDIISDSVLDAYLEKDPLARVAVETIVKNNTVILVGEVSSDAEINTEAIVRKAINEIGYNHDELGFNGNNAEIILRIDRHRPILHRALTMRWKCVIQERKESLVQAIRGWCSATAAYGHFGRKAESFTWENTDAAQKLRKAVEVRHE